MTPTPTNPDQATPDQANPDQANPDLDRLTRRLVQFRDARDWQQFHRLKDLIVSLNLEAAELLELCQWKSDLQVEEAMEKPDFRNKLSEEMADIFVYLLLICEKSGIDLIAATDAKIDGNDTKYPVDKARGRADKYTAYKD